MDYRLELLHADDFENMVNTICQNILGMGLISFASGKDGGRDGRFDGSADNYPSVSGSWEGKFIIQSKHTSNPIASCSDNDFTKIVNEEIEKIKILKLNNEIDNYLLFTNRKYSGVKGEALRNKMILETGIENIVILGKETINNNFLNSHKDIVRQYRLDLNHIPFNFSDEEIKEIILEFKNQLPRISQEVKKKVNELKHDFGIIDKTEKNIKNNLSKEYYEDEILSRSLLEFDTLDAFLKDPLNSELKDYYFDTAHELNQMISLKRGNFDVFEEIFIFIYKSICDGAVGLKGSKRHVTTFLHYMYYECLIGRR